MKYMDCHALSENQRIHLIVKTCRDNPGRDMAVAVDDYKKADRYKKKILALNPLLKCGEPFALFDGCLCFKVIYEPQQN
jgi:hypothetical protein